MIIRYVKHEGVYMSLNDVTDLLWEKGLLTVRQGRLFKGRCKAYVNRELAGTYTGKRVCDALQPVILPHGDYFFSGTLWTSLLGLLPRVVAAQPQLSYVSYLLSEPDSVHRHPTLFSIVDPIGPTRRMGQRPASRPVPLVLEERDN